MYTDGIANAGRHYGQQLDVCMLLQSILEDQEPSSKDIADSVIYQAMRLDQGQPADDMSVVVLRVLPKERDSIRRMIVSIPFQNEFE
jgi:serine phosphatase RsbU (regulator of sigma subunit)